MTRILPVRSVVLLSKNFNKEWAQAPRDIYKVESQKSKNKKPLWVDDSLKISPQRNHPHIEKAFPSRPMVILVQTLVGSQALSLVLGGRRPIEISSWSDEIREPTRPAAGDQTIKVQKSNLKRRSRRPRRMLCPYPTRSKQVWCLTECDWLTTSSTLSVGSLLTIRNTCWQRATWIIWSRARVRSISCSQRTTLNRASKISIRR